MTTSLKYFAPNESIGLDQFPGETFNAHNRTTEEFRKFAQRANERQGILNATWVWVRNSSGARVRYGGVLALKTKLSESEDHDEFVMDGDVPAVADTFGIAMRAVDDNAVGPFAIAGAVRANVFIRHSELKWVDVDPGRTDRMISHPAGRCQVLEPLSQGTHRTWVMMNHEGPTKWRCKPRVDIARDSSGDVDLFGINPSIPIDILTGVKVDWLTQETVYKSSEAICTYFRHEKLWRITHAECSVSTTAQTYENSVGTPYTNKDGVSYDTPPI